jgi:general secretion pathway protein F
MLVFLVPRLTTIFSDLGQALPLPTRFLISSSNFFSTYWWLLLIVFLLSGGALYAIRKTAKGLYLIDKWTLKLPFFGSLFEKLSIARFARTLGSLLENGVSMLTALDIVKNVVGNSLVSETIEKSAVEVEKGHGLSEALGAYKVFPDLTLQMIQVGEHSGDLESMLNKVADIYENEVELTAVGITSLLEPAIVVIMAVVIGFIVLSIALPIMEMNQLVR